MRKLLFFLALFMTFSLAAYFGYTTASSSLQSLQDTSPIPPTDTPPASQQNILLIQVDNLESERPVLRAVWVFAQFQSANQTVLTFSPLYPSQDNVVYEKNFSLDPDKSPARRFLRIVATSGIRTDGYLLVDDLGTEQITAWVHDQGIPTFSKDTPTTETFLREACAYLSGTSPVIQDVKFDWQRFDTHFQSDLALDTLMASWNQIFDPTRPTHCEVLSQ
jgi:hypothetical protein